jgi:signal transduction histidine kinase/CheY-like chemotaxis protein
MDSTPPAAAHPGRLHQWWLNRSVRAKGIIVVAVPLISLIGITSTSLVLQANERQERAAGRTASDVSSAAQQVMNDALNAETGLRGYAATGDPIFLQPYNLTLTRVGKDRAALRQAAVAEGDSRQEQAVDAAMTKELAALARLRSTISAGAPAAALKPALVDGKRTMDVLRRQIVDLARGPAATVVARRADISQMESTIVAVSIANLALGVLAGVLGIALFTSGIARRLETAVADAGRLGEGEPIKPGLRARDELGRLSNAHRRAEELMLSRTTELVGARDEAVRATQAKNVFLASTSHELRTPLNAVLGFTQLLQMSDLSEEDRDAVERILAAGHHLLALINELIDIARIESGEFSLSVEPVAMQPVVEETCRLMAPLAADRSITISQHFQTPALAVKADRQRLRQILVNLMSNAIKYNREGGAVVITCQAPSPDQVSLTMADTGPGIAGPDLDRIFDPFERLGAEQTAIEGTGIGLPLARAFAEAMEGHLTAASIPGEGTTFTVTLPRAADMVPAAGDDRASVPVPRTGSEDPAGTDLSVLYIEDNPANIEVVSRFMRTRPGVRLQSATSGQAGLALAAQEIPDLILLDLHLPGLHGHEVLRRLKAEPATAGIPVAILSAEAAPAVIRNMRASGVIAYLTKPLDLTELGQLIDSFAAQHEHEAGPAPRTAPAP